MSAGARTASAGATGAMRLVRHIACSALTVFLLVAIAAISSTAVQGKPRPPEPAAPGREDPTTPPVTPGSSPAVNQPQEGESEKEPAAQAIPEDDSVKIKIDPVLVGNLVDRVIEPATITVIAPGALSAEVYLLPVDAPYGGKPTGKARLIGKDLTPANGFTVRWSQAEPDQYVKIFAVVHKKDAAGPVRSHTLDIGLSGRRLRPHPRSTP